MPGPRGFAGSSGPPVSKQLFVHKFTAQRCVFMWNLNNFFALLQGEMGLPGAPGLKGPTGPKVIVHAHWKVRLDLLQTALTLGVKKATMKLLQK